MAQQAGNSKNPLNINPFWERASAKSPLEWTKWAAILEMAVFAKDGIEIRNLLRSKLTLVDPVEPVYEIEIYEIVRCAIQKNELVGKTTS